MKSKNVTETKAQLSSLLEEVENGEEIVITRGKRPIAKIISFQPKGVVRKPGKLKGQIKIASDFDESNDEILKLFELN